MKYILFLGSYRRVKRQVLAARFKTVEMLFKNVIFITDVITLNNNNNK